jgi:hypothetical protein
MERPAIQSMPCSFSGGRSIWLIKQHRQIVHRKMIPDRPNNMVSVMMITFVFVLGSIMVQSHFMDDSLAEVDVLVRIEKLFFVQLNKTITSGWFTHGLLFSLIVSWMIHDTETFA